MYSRYLHDNDVQISDDSIKSFVDQGFVIIKDYNYGNIIKTLSLKSSVLSDGKIILPSAEAKKRIYYLLTIQCMRHKDTVLKYRNRTYIQEYYKEITDFNYMPRQVILYGEKSVENWINKKYEKYNMTDKILFNSKTPYFFKNSLVSDNVMLAQNADSLKDAISINVVWYEQGYNKVSEDIEDGLSYIFYGYPNSTGIKKYKIRGKKKPYTIRIIGYQDDDDNDAYTAILSLK